MSGFRQERFFYFAEFPDRPVPLHAMIVNCGAEHVTSRDYRWDGRKRGDRELVIWQYTAGGEGSLEFDGASFPQRAGDAMLLIVPEDHCYSLPANSEAWDIRFVSLNGREAVRLARECRRLNSGPIYHHRENSAVTAVMDQILRECRTMDAYRASELAYGMMTRLLAETLAAAHPQDAADPLMPERIRQYCMEHLAGRLDVAVLAEISGVSRWHFSRRFRRAVGMPPGKFVTDLRMRAAMRMLQSTHWNIKEIAAACGFDDPSYFCKVFRKTHGAAPGHFRKT